MITVVVLLLMLGTTAGAQARSNFLYLQSQEVVPYGTGDPNMFGEANLDINAGHAQLCYTLRVFIYTGPWPPTGATINHAPAGQNGPEVVNLKPHFEQYDPYASGCVSISSRLAHDIQKHPTDYYLLVTDADYPLGGARAQLTR